MMRAKGKRERAGDELESGIVVKSRAKGRRLCASSRCICVREKERRTRKKSSRAEGEEVSVFRGDGAREPRRDKRDCY